MTLVSNYPDLLQKLFVEADEVEGRYTVRLYYEHQWRNITVDDRIPCGKDGFPAYGHNTTRNEIWVCILEKAFAKMLGSYEALDGGYLEEGVVFLTGGRPERLYINNWSNSPSKQPWRKDRLWDKLVMYNNEEILMGCGITSDRGEAPNEAKGLVAGHAYAILDVKETNDKKFKLIKLRNPWGQFEWKGPWSDSSRNWTFQYRKEMACEVKDDGVFWMEFKDFCTYYDKMTCCRMLNDSIITMPSKFKPAGNMKFPIADWKRKKMEGEWGDSTAGGSMTNMAFAKNPHFKLTAQKSGRFFLIIYRPYIQLDADAQYYRSGIGFSVYKGTDSNYKVLPSDNSQNSLLQYPVYARYNSIELDLDQGEYVITPCTLYSNRKGKFIFEIYSPVDFDAKPLDKDENGKDSLTVIPNSARGASPRQTFNEAQQQNSSRSSLNNKQSSTTLNGTQPIQQKKAPGMMTTYQFEFANSRNKF